MTPVRLCTLAGLLLLLTVVPLFLAFRAGVIGVDFLGTVHRETIRAVTFESRSEPARADVAGLAELGVSHVTIIPFGFQQTALSTEIRFNPDARWYSESDGGIATIAKWATETGMDVIIKPHIWVGRYSSTEGQTRDKISFDSEEAWQQWENSYRAFAMHYAQLAAAVDADVFVVGTELASVARNRPDFWRSLVGNVRSVFSGRLTYAANWWEEYEHVEFWGDLDFIGVQAYFPVYEGDDRPGVDKLIDGWNRHMATLGSLSEKYNRPVLFTEIGYRSVDYAAARPWVWAPRRNEATEEPDNEMQASLYEAFFESVWKQPWFSGAILWKWHASNENRNRVTDFTPQNKPAESTIRKYFLESAGPR